MRRNPPTIRFQGNLVICYQSVFVALAFSCNYWHYVLMADSVFSPVSLLMICMMTKLGSHFTKHLNNVEVESSAGSST